MLGQRQQTVTRKPLNPLLPQPVKISGLNDTRRHLQTNSIHITHLLSMACVLMKILSHASAKKKKKRFKGFKCRTFICRF